MLRDLSLCGHSCKGVTIRHGKKYFAIYVQYDPVLGGPTLCCGGGHLMTLGTDTTSHGDFLGGFSTHRDMHTMVLAGIPAESVLKIATINGARALRKGELIGPIDAGKLADLVVVQGKPLHDITSTRKTRLIVKSGKIYQPEELFAFVEGKIGPQDSDEVADWFKYQELLD